MKRLIEYINAHALAIVAILSLAMIVGLLSGMTMAHGKTVTSIPGQVADEEPFWDPDFYDGNIDLHPYFAMIDPEDRSEEKAEWPSVPGGERASCLVFCPNDACYSRRMVLLVGSPQEKPLLEWVNEYVCSYMDCISEGGLKKLDAPKDARQIADHYVGYARKVFRAEKCMHDPDCANAITEQNALFVGVAMLSDDICTFMTHTWFDQLSCGDRTRRSWYSVMRDTGKELKYQDIISEDCKDAFIDLLLANLRNCVGLWTEEGDCVGRDELLSCMNGCALVEEGLVVYYHPYNIGCGAAGQFNALIPYGDLLKIIRQDSPVKDWILRIRR